MLKFRSINVIGNLANDFVYFFDKSSSMKLKFQYTILILVLAVLIWSGISPKDRFTWFLETAPVFLGIIIAVSTYRSFPLTKLLYILIFLHCTVLCVGGKYTYAEVPIGFWVQELLGQARNNYDRLGHIFQGFVPAIIAREILIRKKVVNGKAWLFFLVTCICVSLSVVYELIEWGTAVITGEGAEAFLGTQGDVWDTQWDMFLALIGALLALTFISRFHDRQLKKI